MIEKARPGQLVIFEGMDDAGNRRAAEEIAAWRNHQVRTLKLTEVFGGSEEETQKHLERVLAGAESAGWDLFFDQAVAVFGKRTKIGDAHDRYAGVDVGAVLRALEWRGALVALLLWPGGCPEADRSHPGPSVLFRWSSALRAVTSAGRVP